MIAKKTSSMLRGIAILIVIASHYAGWMFVEPAHPLAKHLISTWGPPGVDIFLLLSGYGLYRSATGKNGGITPLFVLKRILAVVLPYLVIAALIHLFAGTWTQAAAEGTLAEAVKNYLTASDFWYMQVLFVLYAAFMLCFRFGSFLRVPLLGAAVIGYTVWLYNTAHADFWELSNISFLIGVLAAGAERLWPGVLKRKPVQITVGVVGGIGMFICFRGMVENGGSGVSESFGWELAMNLFFTLIILCLAWLIRRQRSGILAVLGACSLFIYLTHTVLFWTWIFRLTEKMSYAWAAALTGVGTILLSCAVGLLYDRLSSRWIKACMPKKQEKGVRKPDL
ncbi:MAG: acyltransferase [Lachnospiraceae bacterium]|nr:acyltransferase [Lachnospiraceae bacterium]